MRTNSPSPALLLAAALLLASCAAPPPSGEAASNSPGETSAAASAAGATASNPEGLLDPFDPIEHETGEIVELPGLTISYSGLETTGGQLRARFQVVSGATTEDMRLLLPDGSAVPVQTVADELVSDPFGNPAAPPAKTSVITLRIGSVLVPFIAGSPR